MNSKENGCTNCLVPPRVIQECVSFTTLRDFSKRKIVENGMLSSISERVGIDGCYYDDNIKWLVGQMRRILELEQES